MTDWTFEGRWPFAPRYHDSPDGRLHYADEGPRDGAPVVLVHGNPTWGYLYRRFVPALVGAGRRAIVPDLLGFGRSDRARSLDDARVPRHADRMADLLDRLDLRDATLVVHDWGGPIALRWAARNPDRVRRLLVLNTFAPRLPAPMGSRLSVRATGMRGMGDVLVRRLDAPTRFLFGTGMVHRDRLDEVDRRAYRAPHPDRASRTAMVAFPREIPWRDRGPVAEMTAELEAGLREHFRDRPVTLCWGMRDVLFGEAVLDRWRQLLPAARVVRVEDSGHFLPEDAPDRAIEALRGLLAA